jgi:hypothetical protein
MEDKIEINEYVRTETEGIGKVIDIKENPLRYVINEYGEIVLANEIVKHSKNIIDLIEKNDLVNDSFVEKNNGKYLETLDIDYEWC